MLGVKGEVEDEHYTKRWIDAGEITWKESKLVSTNRVRWSPH